MDTAQWPQEMMFKPMDEILIPLNNNHTSFSNSDDNNRNSNSTTLDKKISAQKPQAINCPRCNSTNTKFCYYNNYSLSQPRYICKACKRYWTEGGSVRNIPVGGVSRKNKKPSSNSLKKLPSLVPPPRHSTNTTTGTHENAKSKQWDNQDLHANQALIHDFKTIYDLIQVPKLENESLKILNGITSRECEDNSDNSYMSMPMHNDAESMSMYSSRYTCFPTLEFSLDGIGNGVYESLQGVEESGKSERGLFPFEDLKQVSSTNDHNMGNDIIAQQVDSTEYWNGVLGGGSW